MLWSDLLVAAATLTHLVQAQENGPLYLSIAAAENPLTFVHPETPAGIGDVIIWSFAGTGPQNHSVIQSTYENPCHYLDGGFYSGFVPVPAGSDKGALFFIVTVNNTNPIYYYSGGPGDCQGGMVGVINPPCHGNGINSSGSFNVYKGLAEEVTSVGQLPTAIRGGQLVSMYPTTTLTGSRGPYFTGFSASCTLGTNYSSNTTSATTSAPALVATSGCESVYRGVLSLRNQEYLARLWQSRSRLGIFGMLLLAFV